MGGEPDRAAVGVLGEYPGCHQAFGDLAAVQLGELDSGPQAAARTSRTTLAGSAFSRSCRWVPSLADCSWNSPVFSMAMTSRAMAQASGIAAEG